MAQTTQLCRKVFLRKIFESIQHEKFNSAFKCVVFTLSFQLEYKAPAEHTGTNRSGFISLWAFESFLGAIKFIQMYTHFSCCLRRYWK